jgi:Fic family protein
MKDLVAWLRTSKEEDLHPIIVAGIVHAEIAAIHPFTDGNGRTARALATLILYARGYDFRQLFALEDYYNEERPKYYAAIHLGDNYEERKAADLTRWIEYFVKGFKVEIDNVKTQVIALSKRKIGDNIESQIYLDKEQSIILDFLDQVGRINVRDVMDILDCPRRTAQFHLQKLKKIRMITQVGKGPSSAYVTA